MEWFVAKSPDGTVLMLDYEDNLSTRTRDALEAAGATVTYLPVSSSAAARERLVLQRIKSARAVFLPGGNQWKYVSQWRDTPLIGALRSVWERGGVVGGTSAGAMILGEAVYDARNGGASSTAIAAAPDGPDAAVTLGFLDLVPGTLIDTHVSERNRVIRMEVFLRRAHAASQQWFSALGLDEGTALAIGPDHVGTVYGAGFLSVLTVGESSTGSFDLALLRAERRLDLSDGAHPRQIVD